MCVSITNQKPKTKNRRVLWGGWWVPQDEGTGTQPNYLANSAGKKKSRAIWGENSRKSGNSLSDRGGEVGVKGMMTKGTILHSPGTKYKRSKNVFFFHIYCAHRGTPWYQTVGDICTVSYRECQYPPQDLREV